MLGDIFFYIFVYGILKNSSSKIIIAIITIMFQDRWITLILIRINFCQYYYWSDSSEILQILR
jgi:hypothetical protein